MFCWEREVGLKSSTEMFACGPVRGPRVLSLARHLCARGAWWGRILSSGVSSCLCRGPASGAAESFQAFLVHKKNSPGQGFAHYEDTFFSGVGERYLEPGPGSLSVLAKSLRDPTHRMVSRSPAPSHSLPSLTGVPRARVRHLV